MTKVVHTIDRFPPTGVDQESKSWMFRVRKVYEQLAIAFNGLIGFGDGTNRENINGNWVSFATPGVANTDFTITHNLGRIAVGYIIMSKTATCDLYNGSIAGTKTQITLRATVPGVNINVFFV